MESHSLLSGGDHRTYATHEDAGLKKPHSTRVLGTLAVTAFIYLNVCGGPYGSETMVQSGGPLITLLTFAFMPFIWGYPMGLLATELCSAFPSDSSQSAWASAAFGDVWAFTASFAGFVGGVIDMALFPNLLVSYLGITLEEDISVRDSFLIKIGAGVSLALLNIAGLRIVGTASVIGSCLMILPFLILSVAAIPKIDTANWLETTATFDLVVFINTAVWNLTGWESVSALAGNIKNPERTMMVALVLCSFLVGISNVVPIAAMTGVDNNWAGYDNGHYVAVAEKVGGNWLRFSVAFGAVIFSVLMYMYRLAMYSHQLEGMAEQGLLPRWLAKRTSTDLVSLIRGHHLTPAVHPENDDKTGDDDDDVPGSPVLAILLVTLLSLGMSPFGFSTILKLDNVLYCVLHLSECACFIALRISMPDFPRPYKVPLGTVGCSLGLLPSVFLAALLILWSGWVPIVWAMFVMGLGAILFVIWRRRHVEV